MPLRSLSNELVDFRRRLPYVQNLSAYQVQPRVTSVSRIGNKFRKRKVGCVGAIGPGQGNSRHEYFSRFVNESSGLWLICHNFV